MGSFLLIWLIIKPVEAGHYLFSEDDGHFVFKIFKKIAITLNNRINKVLFSLSFVFFFILGIFFSLNGLFSFDDILIMLCLVSILSLFIPKILSSQRYIPIIICLGVVPFVLAYLQMTIGLAWNTTHLDNSLFVRCAGLKPYSYCQKITPDLSGYPNSYFKMVKIKENGNYLPYQDAYDLDIAKHGMGRYLVLNNSFIMMSSTDNSDPRINGKTYEIIQPTPMPLEILWLAGILALFTLYLLRSTLQLKVLLPFSWFFMLISALPIISRVLWLTLLTANFVVGFFLLKDKGTKTLNRREMLGYLALYCLILYGFLEIR